MADALVAALVSTILRNLNSLVREDVKFAWNLNTELEKLESKLSMIQAVLRHEDNKQWKSEPVQNWLRKLKDAAYDVDDVLDEFAIVAQRWKLQMGVTRRVKSFFSLENSIVFHLKMAHNLKSVREKLDAVVSERDIPLQGVWNVEEDSSDWRETSSLVNESEVVGRRKEKEELINMLLTNSGDLSVYAICGMGGLGKTTLAKLIYNDGRVESHFELRMWVCVSDDFNVTRLARDIIESVEEGVSHNIQKLDPWLRKLQEKLSGKKFFLVLDDVWNEDHARWHDLKDALSCGAEGSVVIATTRIEKVAVMMEAVRVYHLGRLSDDDSWDLFERRAFGMERKEGHEQLKAIGKAIVKKCGGVPLAIKALGVLMHFKREESQWLSVERSEIWDLPDEASRILDVLRLSYTHLWPPLKQCFTFCSIFPKDAVMRKDQLIELWMANGFIYHRGQMDLHDMGHEIFNELVRRSFFQEVEEDEWGNTTCKMHDLVHDLAVSIMMDECCLLKPDMELADPRKIRYLAAASTAVHLEVDRELENSHHFFALWLNPSWEKEIIKIPSLRSFVLLDSFSPRNHTCFAKQRHLRALHLPNFRGFNKLSTLIGKLKHLRYLDLSESCLRSLSESTTNLQNLQILNLQDCEHLYKLPKDMRYMRKLTYLNLKGCNSLKRMPARMGELTCLRKLSIFIVGKGDGHHIKELKSLKLGGELSIKNLDDVEDLTDAKNANLSQKKDLRSLVLSWHKDGSGRGNVEEVLSGLQPHSSIKKLRISNYQGSRLPNWMADLLLPNLVEVWLENCRKCERLPPFGKLQFLKDLCLSGMDGVMYFDNDVYGDTENPFPSLESLTFRSMTGFEGWTVAGRNQSFCRLHKLTVIDCPSLDELPIIPSVRKLKTGGSVALLKSVMNFTLLTDLDIADFPELTLLPDGLLQNLTNLEHLAINGLPKLESLSNHLNNLCALKSLGLYGCPGLKSLPEEGLRKLNSLETLEIYRCGLVSLPVNGLYGLNSLSSLYIAFCDEFTSLSEGVQYLTSLGYLSLQDCPKMNSLPESIGHLTALRKLKISNCGGLCRLPNGMRDLSSLSTLEIHHCTKLVCLPEGIQNLNLLRELSIRRCPHLERRCEKERGEDWSNIAHIPNILINFELVQHLDA